jgi:hypothetical protein
MLRTVVGAVIGGMAGFVSWPVRPRAAAPRHAG